MICQSRWRRQSLQQITIFQVELRRLDVFQVRTFGRYFNRKETFMLSSITQTKQNMSFLSQKKKDFVIFVQELTLILRPALLCHGSALFVWHHLPTLCSLLQQMWTAAGRVASHEERGDTRASQLQQDPWWIVKRACIFLNCPHIKSDESSYYLVLFHPHNLCTWPLSCVFPNVGRDRLWDTKTPEPSTTKSQAYSGI